MEFDLTLKTGKLDPERGSKRLFLDGESIGEWFPSQKVVILWHFNDEPTTLNALKKVLAKHFEIPLNKVEITD